jgi:hypothetical protein
MQKSTPSPTVSLICHQNPAKRDFDESESYRTKSLFFGYKTEKIQRQTSKKVMNNMRERVLSKLLEKAQSNLPYDVLTKVQGNILIVIV